MNKDYDACFGKDWEMHWTMSHWKKKTVPERKPLFEVELSTYQGENLQGGGAEYDSVEKLGS